MLLARKIGLAKWRPHPNYKVLNSPDDISADAITADLRTESRSLSLWACESASDKDIKNVALALAASMDRLGKIELVLLDQKDILQGGHKVNFTEGETPALDLRDRHVDVCDLTYQSLGNIAHLVMSAVQSGRCKTVPQPEVSNILKSAIQQKRVDFNKLSEPLKRKFASS